MENTHKNILITILVTGLLFLIVATAIATQMQKFESRQIQDCYNAGNKPIPCVEAVLGPQN